MYHNLSFLTAKCGDNKVHNPFITMTQPSCKDLIPSQNTRLPPGEGCICINGYVLDNENNQCIQEDECGCSTDDNYYAVC